MRKNVVIPLLFFVLTELGWGVNTYADSPCLLIFENKLSDVPSPSDIDYSEKESREILTNTRECLSSNNYCFAVAALKNNNRITKYNNISSYTQVSEKLSAYETVAFIAFQFKTKENKLACIIAANTYTNASPWMARGWTIDNKRISEVEDVIYYAPTTWSASAKELVDSLTYGLNRELASNRRKGVELN